MPKRPPSTNGALTDADRALLSAIERGNVWLRSLLCTLARRGAAFRLRAPERADALLASLSHLPLYRGGQFLFDLMEWEDFMLDGRPPPVLATTLDGQALLRLAEWLNGVQGRLDGGVGQWDASMFEVTSASVVAGDADLPPLEGGMYLYPNVVLGIVVSAAPAGLPAPPGGKSGDRRRAESAQNTRRQRRRRLPE
jgi:hypothetical protein